MTGRFVKTAYLKTVSAFCSPFNFILFQFYQVTTVTGHLGNRMQGEENTRKTAYFIAERIISGQMLNATEKKDISVRPCKYKLVLAPDNNPIRSLEISNFQ